MNSSLCALLMNDVQTIANEARRRAPEVKTKADDILHNLKSLKDKKSVAIADIQEQVDLAGLLRAAANSSQGIRLMPHIVAILQRTISNGALEPSKEGIMTALEIFEAVSSQGPEELQLKALQCMMPLLSNYACHGKVLVKVFEVTFRMVSTRNITLVNTATAIIRQLLIWLFEKVQEELALSNGKFEIHAIDTSESYTLDTYFILRDIFLLAREEKAAVLPMMALQSSFALELIESVLARNGQIFGRLEEYSELIKSNLRPVIEDQFKKEVLDFALLCRLWRVIVVIVREYVGIIPEDIGRLLSAMVNRLEAQEVAMWERVLMMEVLQEILMLDDAGRDAFTPLMLNENLEFQWARIIEGVSNTAISMVASLSCQVQYMHYNQAHIKISLLQLFDKQSPPTVAERHLLYSSLITLFHQIAAFDRTLGNIPRPKTLEQVWAFIQKPFLLALSSCQLDKGWRDFCLQGLHALLTLLVKADMPDALQNTLMSLSEIALPQYQQASGKSPTPSMGSLIVNELNLSMSLCILRFAQEYGEYLMNSWTHIFRVIHGNDQFNVVKARNPDLLPAFDENGRVDSNRGTSRAKSTSASTVHAELATISEIAEVEREIMERSRHLSSKSFKYFVMALGSLVTESMVMASLAKITQSSTTESISISEGKLTSLDGFKLTMVLFPVQRLKQIFLLNIHRFKDVSNTEINDTWTDLMDKLAAVTGVGDATLRGIGCETVNLSLSQLASAIDPPSQLRDIPLLQERIFGALARILGASPWQDVHKTVLEVLRKLLTSLGPYLTICWSMIFSIITDAVGRCASLAHNDQPTLPILNTAFASTKMLVGEYLGYFDEGREILQLANLLFIFARAKTDLNTSLTSIGLMWDVADYVRQRGGPNHRLFQQWICILKTLCQLSRDNRPEIRNSAIQTTVRAIDISGNNLTLLSSKKFQLGNYNNDAGRENGIQSPTESMSGFSAWEIVCQQLLNPLIQEISQFQTNSPRSSSTSPVEASTGSMGKGHDSGDVEITTSSKHRGDTIKYILEGITHIFIRFGLHLFQEISDFRGKEWTNLLSALKLQMQTPISLELVNAAIGCLAKLANGHKDSRESGGREELAEDIIYAWIDMVEALQRDDKSQSVCIGQDSLLRLLKILPILLEFRKSKSCPQTRQKLIACVDVIINHSTPLDSHIRDFERPTELQHEALMIIEAQEDLYPDLYIGEVALWLNYVHEDPIRGDFEGHLSIKSHIFDKNATIAKPEAMTFDHFTFVGLASLILRNLMDKTGSSTWPKFQTEQIGITSWEKLIDALGRFAIKKYLLPIGSGPLSLWKMATRCLDEITSIILHTSYRSTLWHLILPIFWKVLDTSRYLYPSNLALDQVESDEEFEISQVEYIKNTILPLLVDAPAALVAQFMTSLVNNSRLYDTDANLQDNLLIQLPEIFKTAKATNFLQCRPVIKEKLANACLDLLFAICSDGEKVHLKGDQVKPDQPSLPKFPSQLVQIAYPMLLHHCQSIMRDYSADRKILGQVPFPRIRRDEIIYILRQLNNLVICQTAQSIDASSHKTMNACPKGHLLKLYSEYVHCATLEDNLIIREVALAFEMIGLGLGVMK